MLKMLKSVTIRERMFSLPAWSRSSFFKKEPKIECCTNNPNFPILQSVLLKMSCLITLHCMILYRKDVSDKYRIHSKYISQFPTNRNTFFEKLLHCYLLKCSYKCTNSVQFNYEKRTKENM